MKAHCRSSFVYTPYTVSVFAFARAVLDFVGVRFFRAPRGKTEHRG
jgi:hypothetical protein